MTTGIKARAAPTVTSFSGSSAIASSGTVADSILTLAGTGTPETAVAVFDGSESLGAATVINNGISEFATARPRGGPQSFRAIDPGASKNTGASKNQPGFVLTAPIITSYSIASGLVRTSHDLAKVITDDGTSDNSVALTGTPEAGCTGTIYDGTTQIGIAVANGADDWSYVTGQLV